MRGQRVDRAGANNRRAHRHVSVRLRAVALTCRVTESPKKLNAEIEHMIARPIHSTAGLLIICRQPRARSKKPAYGDSPAMKDVLGGKKKSVTGRRMMIEMVPKNPVNCSLGLSYKDNVDEHTLVADCKKRRDVITRHDLLLQDELGCGASIQVSGLHTLMSRD